MDILITTIIALYSTFWLRKRLKINAIEASVVSTLLFWLMLKICFRDFPEIVYSFSTIFYGATFMAMTNTDLVNNKILISSAIVFSLSCYFLIPLLPGFGGTLGFFAFVSIGCTLLMAQKLKFLSQKMN